MTYEQICDELVKLGEGSTLTALQRLVREEAAALCPPEWTKNRRAQRSYEEAAQEYYAEDITHYLQHPAIVLTPGDVLGYRRHAGAWAVARRIRSARTEVDDG